MVSTSIIRILFLTSILTSFSNIARGENRSNGPMFLCQNGQVRQGFLNSVTSGDIPCPTGFQTCVGGEWQGPQIFDTCENYTKSCNGIYHGSVQTGYLQPVTPKGIPCPTATKVCLNGDWIGPQLFDICTEI